MHDWEDWWKRNLGPNWETVGPEYFGSVIKNVSDLKLYLELVHDSVFFARENMRFFGDTMKNYGLKKNVVIEDIQGEERTVFELRRKNAVKNGLKSSAYFDMVTLERVFDNFTMR